MRYEVMAQEDEKQSQDEEFLQKKIKVIAEKIKRLRIEKGHKSYETFAWEYNIGRMQYWKMEKGMTNFTIRSLLKILQAHNLSLKDFFEDIE